jgi:hypothetical protein
MLPEQQLLVSVEKRTRYIYNPFLLNAAYQKVDFGQRLRQLYVWRAHRFCDPARGMDSEERYRLIKENLVSEQITADLLHLVEAMRRERFAIDVYHCNYEYALYRLYCVLLPPAQPESYPAGLCDITLGAERLPVERRLEEALMETEEGAEAARCIVLRALDRYVARHYFVSLVNYNEEAIKRTSLLLNLKHRMEADVAKKQRADPDYVIEYNRDVVLSMMYVFLVQSELSALCREEVVQLRTLYQTYRKPVTDDDYVKCERKIRRAERASLVMDELAQRLWAHFYDEFYAFSFALITSSPACAADTVVMQRYVMLAPGQQKTVARVKDLEGQDFVVQEKQCDHIRYISLRKNRDSYEHVTRRMIFDHLLLQTHSALHAGDADASYTRCCQVCRYAQLPDSLCDFYAASAAHTYYLCEYVVASHQMTQEFILARFLHSMIVDPLTPLTSLIYKNATQAMLLFCDATGYKLNLFHVVDVHGVLQYVTAQYPGYEHGPEARQDLIVRQSLLQQHATGRVEQWQKKLARDIDIYTLLMLAVNAQSAEVEKYERALRDSVPRPNLTAPLFAIYQLYVNVLDDTMKKIY